MIMATSEGGTAKGFEEKRFGMGHARAGWCLPVAPQWQA
jgi:hypothetical protein